MLEKHPPSLGRVLKLDPALLDSPDYLANYPALAAFLASIRRSRGTPGFFLGRIRFAQEERPLDARGQAIQVWNNMFEGIAVFVVMTTIIGSLMWLIRTMIDYRRWARLTKVQQDVHTKLLDRFTVQRRPADLHADAGG